ncbi:hypothetical protein J3F83DRAFT_739938 [Trichoderma novae-zelandiae]
MPIALRNSHQGYLTTPNEYRTPSIMPTFQILLRLILGTSSRASWNTQAAILQLPPDILLTIADTLGLQDLFILSQVCRAFRHLLHRDWRRELSRLRPRYQFSFWTGLARNRPGYFPCGRCCKVHRVGNSDRPIAWAPSVPGWRRLPCGAHYRERRG